MITYNKYINNEDNTWYDSSNVVFSKCYDTNDEMKTLKVVFKNGRTYVYKNVSVNDYLLFKTSPSNGSAINEYIIKKYKGVRISDTDISALNEYKENLQNSDSVLSEEKISQLCYNIDFCPETNNFILSLNNTVIYKGKENQVSIFNLLKSMNIPFSIKNVENVNIESDEDKEEINF